MIITDEDTEAVTTAGTDVNTRRYNALVITGIILPFLLYPFLSLIFLSYGTDFALKFTLSRVLIWGIVGLMYLYAHKGEVQDFLLWRSKKYNIGFYFKAIIGLFLLCFAAEIIAAIPRQMGLHEDNSVYIKINVLLQKHPLLLVFTALTAGITEELVFRGYILSRLSLFFKNKHWQVIISALMFAAIHLSYKTVAEFLFAFLIGLIFGYHYQRYRNLSVLMTVHFLVDFVALLMFRMHK